MSVRHILAFSRDDKGVAALEFGLIAPLLIAIAVCTVDLGMGFYQNMQVQNAAQAGATYASLHGFAATGISNAVLSATDVSGLTVSPAPAQACGCPSSAGIVWTDCSMQCSGGASPGTYVTVGAQATYNTLLPYPGVPQSFTLSAQTVVRIH